MSQAQKSPSLSYKELKKAVDVYEPGSAGLKLAMNVSRVAKHFFESVAALSLLPVLTLPGAEGLAGLGLVMPSLMFSFSGGNVVAAGAGAVSAVAAAGRLTNQGKTKPGESGFVQSLCSQFRKEAGVYICKQALSSAFFGYAAATLTLSGYRSGQISETGFYTALGLMAAGAATGLWARRNALRMDNYQSAIDLSRSGQLYSPLRPS